MKPAPLVEQPETAEARAQDLAVRESGLSKPTASGMLPTFERLASDPTVDVDKLERLMQMYERATARVAEEHFNSALSQAQTKMRPIAADAENPQTRSKYASYAALDRALRPVYTEFGFGVSFDTGDSPLPEHVRVLAYVTHRGGFARTYHVDMPADGKGARGGDVMTKTHATGAAMSYGMRYLQKMIWNVAVGEDDRDGNRIESPRLTAPEGFANWFLDMEATATEGIAKLQDAWNQSSAVFRRYVSEAHRDQWEALKRKARAVKP